MRSFCRKTHVHKIPRLGGGYLGLGGGGGREDFSTPLPSALVCKSRGQNRSYVFMFIALFVCTCYSWHGLTQATMLATKKQYTLFYARELRGPAAILFISRDTFSDSIANLFCACFPGVSHKYRAICCKMGYRTDMSAPNKAPRGGYRTLLGDCWDG